MAEPGEKFIGYFRLVEACTHPGCPVCRCLEDDSRRELRTVLYEHVTDPETRRRFRESWGFCNWHTWMLLEGDSVATGTAILYDDLLRVCGAQIERVRDRPPRSVSRLFTWCAWLLPRSRALRRRRALALYRERAPCGICARLRVIEAHYVTTFAELAADAQLDDAYQHSTGLCVPHLVHVLEIGRDGAALGKVLDETLRKWGSLRIDLQRFVAKHDHRNTARFTAAEADSYRRALEIMAGRRGVFGIDTRRGSAHG